MCTRADMGVRNFSDVDILKVSFFLLVLVYFIYRDRAC